LIARSYASVATKCKSGYVALDIAAQARHALQYSPSLGGSMQATA
jgi:hypothetical protein